MTVVHGIPDLREALKSIPDKLRKRALRNALAAGARVVRDVVQRSTPVLKGAAKHRTPGTLKKAISVRTSKAARRAGDVGVFVNVKPAKGSSRGAKTGKDPFYWRWVNFGWTPASGPRTKANSRLRRRARKTSTGAPTIQGKHFLEEGAKALDRALQVFIQKIGPAIDRLNRKQEP